MLAILDCHNRVTCRENSLPTSLIKTRTTYGGTKLQLEITKTDKANDNKEKDAVDSINLKLRAARLDIFIAHQRKSSLSIKQTNMRLALTADNHQLLIKSENKDEQAPLNQIMKIVNNSESGWLRQDTNIQKFIKHCQLAAQFNHTVANGFVLDILSMLNKPENINFTQLLVILTMMCNDANYGLVLQQRLLEALEKQAGSVNDTVCLGVYQTLNTECYKQCLKSCKSANNKRYRSIRIKLILTLLSEIATIVKTGFVPYYLSITCHNQTILN